MRVIILNEDKTFYDSTVFAIENEPDKKHPEYVLKTYFYIVNSENKIERMPSISKNHVRILIRNLEPSNYCSWIEDKKNNIEGYNWFINSKNTIENIKNNLPISKEIENECLEVNSGNLSWYESERNSNVIVNQEDIKNILEFTGWFHDGHIEKIDNQKDGSLRIDLSGVWGFESFSLIFKGNIETYFEDDLDELWFSSASIFIDKDKQICFSIDDYSSKEELNKTKVTRIYADSLKIDYKFDFDFR